MTSMSPMPQTLLNYNPYEGESETSPLSNSQVNDLAIVYQQILDLPEKPNLDLIKSYQPSWNWYSEFKAMDRIDVQVYNYDLLAPGFDLLSFIQSNLQDRLISRIREFLVKRAKLDSHFDSSDPINLKVTKDRIYSSPLVVLVHKFTGKDPDLIIEELVELSDLENSNARLVLQYEELFELISDLYQTMILKAPPLDTEIILFGSESLSFFQLGTVDLQNWDDPNHPAEIIHVPAGSQILPYYKTSGKYDSDLRLHFLLPLETQLELIDQKRLQTGYQWALELRYTKSVPNSRIKTLFTPRIDRQVKIYRVDRADQLIQLKEPHQSQFESPLKLDLTTINYHRHVRSNFPSRLSSETQYNFKMGFPLYERDYPLMGNVADLFYRIQKFIHQEESDLEMNQLISLVENYLPSLDWLSKIEEYIRSDNYHITLVKAYNNNGDRFINGYLRHQLTFHQFILRYLKFRIAEDPAQKERDLNFVIESKKWPFSLSEEFQDLLIEKLKISSDKLYLDLLEYAFFGYSRDSTLEIYESLNYELSVDLQNLILTAPPLNQELMVYRGVQGDHFNLKCSPGEQFTMEGMISTSIILETAACFGCHLFIIRIPAGSRILPLTIYELKHKDEKEILLPHGSTFILDKCVDVPYLETISFGSVFGASVQSVCVGAPVHLYFCHLISQPTVGP